MQPATAETTTIINDDSSNVRTRDDEKKQQQRIGKNKRSHETDGIAKTQVKVKHQSASTQKGNKHHW